MKISVLKNPIQEYAWGSRTFIAELLGKASPSDRPQAELWMGAHPRASSRIFADGRWRLLTEVIRENPQEVLGKQTAQRFSGELPFLFKVLAAAAPLSVQVHPDRNQARSGFQRENRQGIPLDSPRRNYRDAGHKPEILCALTDFQALKGFRPLDEILEGMKPLAHGTLEEEIRCLQNRPDREGLKAFFRSLLSMPQERKRAATQEAAKAAARPAASTGAWKWVERLHRNYPHDPGVLSPLLLNLVALQPGQALFLRAGEPHAYLDGAGIELMANSDNVIRGGLTPKHVDVEELLEILAFEPEKPRILQPEPAGENEGIYPTKTDELLLSVLEAKTGEPCTFPVNGVEILLCTRGECRITAEDETLCFPKGVSILVPGSVTSYRMEGEGTVFRARVPPSNGPDFLSHEDDVGNGETDPRDGDEQNDVRQDHVDALAQLKGA